MRRIGGFRVQLVLLAAAACLIPFPAAAVPKYDTADVVLHASQVFNGNSGSPNPFTTVELTLTVTAPDGRTFTVDGFFDGDGNGGAIGDVWKARIYLDQEGTWTWTSSSAQAGLDGQSGQVTCSGLLPGAFGKGPIVVRSGRPRYFAFADGTPIFLLGKMLDFDSPTPLQRTTMTLFSEVLTDADRATELAYQHDLVLNKMGVYVYNRDDFSGTEPTTPWVGTKASNDRTRFDLARWKVYDTWTRQMRDEGFVTQLWIFADNSGVGGFLMPDRLRLIRYTMARLSGYVNTMFLVTAEWEEAWSAAEIEQGADTLQQYNPWRRLASTHCLPGDFDFPNAGWADYTDIQSGITAGHGRNHSDALATRMLGQKPAQAEEFAQGFESGLSRIKAWSVFVAAQAGIGTGAYQYFLAPFTEQVPFYKMEPADSKILAGSAYCMAEPGWNYVAYAFQSTSFTLDLTGTTGAFEADWYDPQSGTWSDAGNVAGGTTPTFVTPGFDDMALWVRPATTGASLPGRVTGLGFPSKILLDWEVATLATSFDAVKGSLNVLRSSGGFTTSVLACLENDGAGDRRASDSATPAPGQGWWYLVRGVKSNGTPGSFGMSEPKERPGRDAEVTASANDCP